MKSFYTNFIQEDKLARELGMGSLGKNEKTLITGLIKEILQDKILDFTLSFLSKEDQKQLILLMKNKNNPKYILEFLERRIEGFRGKIKKLIEDYQKELKLKISQIM